MSRGAGGKAKSTLLIAYKRHITTSSAKGENNLMTINETSSSQAAFNDLQQQKYILLKTVRKSGTAVATPVWFAKDGEKLYVTTNSTAGKVKRIHNNSHVLLSPCDRQGNVLGAEVAGQARELPIAERAIADSALAQKFGLFYQVFKFMGKLSKSGRTFLEIVPEKAF
jgi:PPOX class probable F420-dependent enzyme